MFKGNPFRKYLTKEHLLHEACVIWLKVQHPKLLFTHVPNEGKKTPFERFLYKILGVKTGTPDLLIFQPMMQKGYAGLAIEFKLPGNKPTSVQNATIEQFRRHSWHVEVVETTEQFVKVVTQYFKI